LGVAGAFVPVGAPLNVFVPPLANIATISSFARVVVTAGAVSGLPVPEVLTPETSIGVVVLTPLNWKIPPLPSAPVTPAQLVPVHGQDHVHDVLPVVQPALPTTHQ